MNPVDALWHVLNFFAPALGVAALAAVVLKLLWWRAVSHVAWSRLLVWSAGPTALVLVCGLAVFGRDGRMETYGAMVLGCALGLGWAAFSRPRG